MKSLTILKCIPPLKNTLNFAGSMVFTDLQFLEKLNSVVHFVFFSKAWLFGIICQNFQKDLHKNQVS